MPPNTMCVTRPGRWSNPFDITKLGGLVRSLQLYSNTLYGIWDPAVMVYAPAGALEYAYQQYMAFLRRFHYHPLKAARTELVGKNLACWCPPHQKCHCDILLPAANGWSEVGRP